MKIDNYLIKPDSVLSQKLNYLALILTDLAGNDEPEECELQEIEQKLAAIIHQKYLQNLTQKRFY